MLIDMFRTRILPLGMVFIMCVVPAAAQDEQDPQPIFSTGTRPLAVATAASVDRLKEEAAFIFEAAGAPEALDSVLAVLDDNLNGLQGLNWERPAGVMMYLDGVFPPAMEFVAFLPISSVEEFQSMMELGTVIMREEPTEEGRYELITPRRNIQVRVQGDYAFIQMPMMDPDPAFDRELPDPMTLVSGLVSQFDLAVSLHVESIPKATRDLIFNVLSSTMSTQMQQRDDEPESRYELRRSWMQADLDGLKLLFDECKRISIGLNVDQEENGANIDFLISVRDGSKMLEEIFASTTKPSYFIPLLNETAPVSLTWSGVMAERDRERYDGVLEALKGEIARGIEEQDLGPTPDESSPLFHALSALQATAREGHLDVFAQFYRDSSDKLAVVSAMRVEDGDSISGGLFDLLTRVQGKDDIGEIELAAHEHAGVTFHRLRFKDPDAGAKELFGDGSGLTFGCGPRSMWVCLGGDDSFETLTGVMDELTEAYENPIERTAPASFRLVVHTNQLIELVQGAEAAKRASAAPEEPEELISVAKDPKSVAAAPRSPQFGGERRARVRQRRSDMGKYLAEALAEGDDRIQLEARPTDSGMRLRAHFDLGFVRGVGRMIAARFMGE